MDAGKKAVMIGAGNIGRGFIGQILHESGYHVVFVDVDEEIVGKLNRDGSYCLTLTDGDKSETRVIDNVSALHGGDGSLVAEQLAKCDVAATAVGMKALGYIAGNLAAGIKKRFEMRPGEPLNILICENIHHSRDYLYSLLEPYFSGDEVYLLHETGLVETTIGRMVPAPTPEMRRADATAIIVEPYMALPVDEKAFRGKKPELLYTETFNPFEFFEEKKLYIHNLGHAICAYYGAARGYGFIWQAASDDEVAAAVKSAMYLLAEAIAVTYGTERGSLYRFADELLQRFRNRLLGDTVARVGQDPLRKLLPGDRFMGAVERCRSCGMPYDELLAGVAAALRFDVEGDPSAGKMKEMIKEQGVAIFLASHCGLSHDDCNKVAGLL